MQSNFDIFIEKLGKTLMSLHGKYLANAKTLLDQQIVKNAGVTMNAILDLTDSTHKVESILLFEFFCDIIEHVLASCQNKRIFFQLFGVLIEFLSQLRNVLKDAFGLEVADTHYFKHFDKNHYAFEKGSHAFRGIKYPFLYAPVIDVSADASRLYSVFSSK